MTSNRGSHFTVACYGCAYCMCLLSDLLLTPLRGSQHNAVISRMCGCGCSDFDCAPVSLLLTTVVPATPHLQSKPHKRTACFCLCWLPTSSSKKVGCLPSKLCCAHSLGLPMGKAECTQQARCNSPIREVVREEHAQLFQS